MTKLKGTILLGEGYNRTKAIFDCNLPKFESNTNLEEIEKLQLQINNIKDTLEYNELDVDYSKVPFTIEFLEDGYFAIIPGHDTARVEYSTDGGITWEDGELINPIQLAINHNLLFDESFFASWLGIPVEAGDLICLRGLGLFYKYYFEMSGARTLASLGFMTDAKYHIFGNIATLFLDAFRDIDIEFLYNIAVLPLEKLYLSTYPDKADFWNTYSKELKIVEILVGLRGNIPVLMLIDAGVPIEELLKFSLLSGCGNNTILGNGPGWANIASTKQLVDYLYWTYCILEPSSNPLAGISKLLFLELLKLAVIELNKNSQDIFYTEELCLLLMMPQRSTLTNARFDVVVLTDSFSLDSLFYYAPNLISVENLYLQELVSYLIPNMMGVSASMEGSNLMSSGNYVGAFRNNKSLLDGNCIFHLDLPMKIDGTTIRIVTLHNRMFEDCTALRVAPKDLMVGLAKGKMFSGCTNLNYIKFTATNIEDYDLTNWVEGVSPTGTFVKAKGVDIPVGPSGIPEGWTVEEYASPEDHIKELQVSVDANTEEIDILKNRIISTTYSELKDAVTNSTLTTGQYYRITDYVTTCNGTSAKVTDASTIDPENPVDGQSRSAGHQFDIIVRALSPNQLDENATAVKHEGDTYYDSTFNGTVIKYSIENKYWSTEDGKGTIYYMKDHNDNECSYDFTNIEYYYAEATTWYLTFTIKVDARIYLNSIINKLGVLPFVILGIELKSNSYIHTTTIKGNLNTIIFKGPAVSGNTMLGNLTNLIVKLNVNNKVVHSNTLMGWFEDVTLDASGDIISGNTFKGMFTNVTLQGTGMAYNEVVAQAKNLHIKGELYPILCNKINGIITDTTITALSSILVNTFNTISNVNITEYAIQNNIINYCENLTISCPQESMSESSYCINNRFDRVTDSTFTIISNNNGNIIQKSKNINITTKALLHNNLDNINTLTMDYSSKNFEQNKFNRCEHITFTNCGCTYSTMLGLNKYLTFEGTSAGLPSYINIGKSVTYCTFTGMMQTLHIEDGSRYLHFTLANEGIPLNTYVYNVRGSSQTSYLEIPLYGDNNFKQIYKDVSGRIFYTWEDNLVKKGYYLNDNTDTEWKEIPTPEEPVEVPTIPDAVTTALSVATLDLTTRTTIATIAADETLAFTLVPAIQGEYRLVIVNSSEADITITMPTEENYQCLCGATLTIPAQTNIELIINVTDTLTYIRKG